MSMAKMKIQNSNHDIRCGTELAQRSVQDSPAKQPGQRITRASDSKKPALELPQQRKRRKKNCHIGSQNPPGVGAACAVNRAFTSSSNKLDNNSTCQKGAKVSALPIQYNKSPLNSLTNN